MVSPTPSNNDPPVVTVPKPFRNSNPKPVQEEGCFVVTTERKFYEIGDKFIKRNLRPREYMTGYRGLIVPRAPKERLMNEAASLRYIRENTNIPVPTLHCAFEDDEAYYLITEYVQGVAMASLEERQKETVKKEIKVHLETMRNLKSRSVGGPSGLIVPPYRVTLKTDNDKWVLPESQTEEYVFCHNDLSQHNIIVDPTTLKINAIIDWEYSGFWPEFFEFPFYNRPGFQAPTKDEIDNTRQLLDFLEAAQDRISIDHCDT